MKKFNFLTITLIIGSNCLFPLTSKADSVFVDVGLGVYNSALNNPAECKIIKLGIEEDLWYNLKQRFSGGFWLDNAGDGRTGSGFASYQLGFGVENQTFNAGVYTGPAIITSPDTYLGGNFQFNETIHVGLTDSEGNSIGISYNHFSSAGIEMPNMGRDFMGAEIKFPF